MKMMTFKSNSGRKVLAWGGALALLLLVLVLVQARYSRPVISHIALQKLAGNRLRFKVAVHTSKDCDVFLQYWPEGGGDTLYADLSADTTDHTLWMVNLREEETYAFQAVARHGGAQVVSHVYDVTTEPIYHATPFLSLGYMDPAMEAPLSGKYFLTQKLDQPGAVIMLDPQGNIVWYESFQKGVRVSHWTYRHTALCILGTDSIPFSGGDEIVEVARSGEELMHLRYGEGDMDKMVHHEVQMDAAGQVYALTFDWRTFDLTSRGGTAQDSVLGDGIVVFNQAGKKVWEWSVFDHLRPQDDPHIVNDRRDWVHANAVTQDAAGDYLISFRDLSQLWKVDGVTGAVKWKLGKDGDFAMAPGDWPSGQHSPHFIAPNQILMLDNGVGRPQTRVLSLEFDTTAMTAHARTVIPLPAADHSIPKGNAYVFAEGQYLLCLSKPRKLVIIDRAGRELWRVDIGGDPYRVELVDGFNETRPL